MSEGQKVQLVQTKLNPPNLGGAQAHSILDSHTKIQEQTLKFHPFTHTLLWVSSK